MQIYLPIAEMSVNAFGILSLGVATGVLSGLFGIGGGFLTTPFLIFIGVPPAVAVSSTANQIIAASFSGFLAQLRRRGVDFRMGGLLLMGGFVGSGIGISVFSWLKNIGQIDLVISVLYVTLLGSVGILMLQESTGRIARKEPAPDSTETPVRKWSDRLPWKLHFPHSKLSISAWLPLGIGLVSGIMVTIMGVGGGFFMIPAMIYILGMPASMVIGTSLFQVTFITIITTFLQAVGTQTVDVVLAMLLIIGSVIGAQLGTRYGGKLPPQRLRLMLAVLVMAIALKLLYGLIVTPENIYTVIQSDY